MATLTITLDGETLRKLTAAAGRIGVTPERLAEVTLTSLLLSGDEFHRSDREAAGVGEPARAWTGEIEEAGVTGAPLTTPDDYAGPFVDLHEALDAFSAELDRRRRSSTG